MSNRVVAPIDKGWTELNGLVDSLGPNGLTITGSDGWAVKDHLIHIAAWEHSLLALLDGRDRLQLATLSGLCHPVQRGVTRYNGRFSPSRQVQPKVSCNLANGSIR